MRQTTLCYPVQGDPARHVLLGVKQRGFGAGKVVGFGGKIEAGETPVEAAARELREEAGIRAAAGAFEARGRVEFLFPHKPEWDIGQAVFVVRGWQGEPRASDEVRPMWFDVEAVPYDRMWDDARYWLPGVLAGGRVEATFVYGADNETVVEMRGVARGM